MVQRIALVLVVLGGCSSNQGGARDDIPAAARPLWDQCRSSLEAWCNSQSQGDPALERECEGTTAHDYAALRDEAARRQYLTAHRCTL